MRAANWRNEGSTIGVMRAEQWKTWEQYNRGREGSTVETWGQHTGEMRQYNGHRLAHLLKQTSITVYHLPTKENKLMFVNLYILKRQHICRYRNISLYKSLYIYICCHFKQNTLHVRPGDFLHPFTACSLCKQKFVLCPFVYEESNGQTDKRVQTD